MKYKFRHKARKYAMQALYSWHISGNNLLDVEAHYLSDRNPKKFEVEYFQQLLHQVPKFADKLDEIIAKYANRAIDSLDPIELFILRIAIYEFKYVIDIPKKVVIDEALELAKTFGSNDSYKFINGTLDGVLKDLGEISKDSVGVEKDRGGVLKEEDK